MLSSAADHCNLSMLNFTFYDPKRNVVRLKTGWTWWYRTCLCSFSTLKNTEACHFKGVKANLNHVYDISILNRDGLKFHREVATQDDKQNSMRKSGTAYSLRIMSDYDILPCAIINMAERIRSMRWHRRYGEING